MPNRLYPPTKQWKKRPHNVEAEKAFYAEKFKFDEQYAEAMRFYQIYAKTLDRIANSFINNEDNK